MIAVDTNILVYAHRGESPWHDRARGCIEHLAAGSDPWVIPWPCLHEFLAVITHPRIFKPPTSLEVAFRQIDAWLESPSLTLECEGFDYLSTLRELVLRGKVMGPAIHDAHVAAICSGCGVDELWSADRDFSRFPQLKVVNPLVQG